MRQRNTARTEEREFVFALMNAEGRYYKRDDGGFTAILPHDASLFDEPSVLAAMYVMPGCSVIAMRVKNGETVMPGAFLQ